MPLTCPVCGVLAAIKNLPDVWRDSYRNESDEWMMFALHWNVCRPRTGECKNGRCECGQLFHQFGPWITHLREVGLDGLKQHRLMAQIANL